LLHKRRADGNAPNITAFLLFEPVVPVSVNGGVPPLPITTKLSRSNGQQRGHTGRRDFLISLRFALWVRVYVAALNGYTAKRCY